MTLSTNEVRRGVCDALQAAAEERDRNDDEVIAPVNVIAVSERADGGTTLHLRDGRRFLVTVTEVTS